jgi:hypothetical protein
VSRRLGYLALAAATVSLVASRVVEHVVGTLVPKTVRGVAVAQLATTVLLGLAVVFGTCGAYVLVARWLSAYTDSRRREHDLRNVLRLVFTVVGFDVTFALQQPLFSLIGLAYIMTKRPYQVGDRVEIDDYLGDKMERNVERYRKELAETPVSLDVRERPTVNVTQRASWVELRVRYLADPRRMQATRNELYERVLAALNEDPDRVKFPIGRTR